MELWADGSTDEHTRAETYCVPLRNTNVADRQRHIFTSERRGIEQTPNREDAVLAAATRAFEQAQVRYQEALRQIRLSD